jgi:hypothetical protein
MAQVPNTRKLGVFTAVALIASTLAVMFVAVPTQAEATVKQCGGWYWNGECCDWHKVRNRQCSDGTVEDQCSFWSTCNVS